jgi:hypothetical protein
MSGFLMKMGHSNLIPLPIRQHSDPLETTIQQCLVYAHAFKILGSLTQCFGGHKGCKR